MQVLSTGTKYRIFDSSLQTYSKLPAAVYSINFDKMEGFSLIQAEPIEVNEKIYGVHEQKVNKVYATFKSFPRNLGVILSGDKGIGKSLFAKLLSIKAIENGYPIIICDKYYPGVANFLNSIQQEVVILFDEFDKTFSKSGDFDPQAEMLTLFDGLYMGKKLFIITCNYVNRLNDYLVNRPGRFHYHFRFGYPTDTEIEEYMRDHIDMIYWSEIKSVIEFSHKVQLNYDCLRAIAFELNSGAEFREAINDLNIVNTDPERYNVILCYNDNTTYKCDKAPIDLFSDEDKALDVYATKQPPVEVAFSPRTAEFDFNRAMLIIKPEDVEILEVDRYGDYDETEEQKQRLKYLKDEKNVAFVGLKHSSNASYNYTF